MENTKMKGQILAEIQKLNSTETKKSITRYDVIGIFPRQKLTLSAGQMSVSERKILKNIFRYW